MNFRNDDLYVPTTVRTTSTDQPLPTPNPDIYKRKGPGPIADRRKPVRTKKPPPPVDEYYDEDEYEDDPYEDRGRRRPQRPRNRRPVYDEEDEEYVRRPYRERDRYR